MKKPGRAKKILLITGGGVLLLLLAIFFAIGSTPLLNYAAGIARQQLAAMDIDLEIGSISGNPFQRLELKQVSLSKNNALLIDVPQASLNIDLWALIRGNIDIENLVLHKPVINVNETTLSLGESAPQAARDAREDSGLTLQIPGFSVNQATINVQLNGYQAYSLYQLQLNGGFAMDAGQYALELEQAHGLWQINDQTALMASGSLKLGPDALSFEEFKLALGDNLLNADGALNWGRQPAANFQLQARFSHDFLPGGDLQLAAPAMPLDIRLKLDSAGQNWRTDLSLEQDSSHLNMTGSVSPHNWLVELNGQARQIYPYRIYAALPDTLKDINLDGDVGLRFTPASLKLALGRISLDKIDFGQLQTDLHWSADLLEIKQFELKQPGGGLNLSAHLPMPFLSASSELKLTLDNFTLPDQQLMQGAQSLQGGVLNGQASLQGTMEKGGFSVVLDKIRTKDNPQPAHLYLAGSWQDKLMKVTQGELKTPWGSAKLAGHAGIDELKLSLDLRLMDINPIFAYLPKDLSPYIPTHGRITGQLNATGALAAPKFDFDIFGQNLKGGSLAVNGVELKGSLLVEEKLTVHGEVNAELLDVAGVSANSLLLSAALDKGVGHISMQLLTANNSKAHMELTPLLADLSSWQIHNISFAGPGAQAWQQQNQARLDLPDNGVKLQNLLIKNNEQSFAAHFSLLDGALSGEVNISQADLGALTGSMPANPILDLRATLAGRGDNPEITLTSQMRAAYNQQTISLELGGSYKNQQAALKGQLLANEQNLLSLSGAGRIPLDGPMEKIQFNAKADKLSLDMLQIFLPSITHLRGTLEMDISLAGTWPQINPQGYIKLSNAGFSVNAIAMNFRRFNMLLQCGEHGLEIRQFDLRSGPGEIHANGYIGWPWREAGALDVGLNAKNLTIKLPPWGRLSLNADLSLGGTYETPVLKGEIVNNSASAQIFQTSHSDLDEVVAMSSDQAPPPLSFDEPEDFDIEVPAFMDSWQVQASIAMSPDFRVNFPQGWFQVSGKVEVDKQPHQDPVYSGRYTIDGGIIVVFGTRIESLSGYVAFVDPASIFPNMDIQATVRKGFTNIMARVHGSAANPILSLTSDPPMSEADILSMLAFGKPIQELNQDQGSNLSSQAMALAVIGEQGRQELQNIVGAEIAPDVITVHNEMQYGSSLEAGKYITRDLYLRYRQGTDKTDSRSLGLEWQLNRRVSLQGQLGTERDTGVDIIFHFVFYETEEQADSVSEDPGVP